MGNIQQLSETVYARIAAGEVIVNPAAAVKELIENAIDAGATAITVEVADGGKSLIRVTDNGVGMSEDDLPLAIARHATSKIHDFDDLYTLHSLGFRGEALSSMAEVSRMTLTTRERGAEIGSRLTVAGGGQAAIEPAGVPEGTTVRIEDLFYNVPARRKFLKAGTREGALVSETVRRALLSRPDIAFKYLRNGRIAYQSPGTGDLNAAVGCVYGPESLRELLNVHGESDGCTIDGCISRPTYIFKSAQRIDFFVNNRYIQSKTLQKALLRGYGESLLHGHYPLAAINLQISPEALDVNVHPAKLTAMFYDEDQLVTTLVGAVQGAVGVSAGAPFIQVHEQDKASGRSATSPAAEPPKPNPDFWVSVPRQGTVSGQAQGAQSSEADADAPAGTQALQDLRAQKAIADGATATPPSNKAHGQAVDEPDAVPTTSPDNSGQAMENTPPAQSNVAAFAQLVEKEEDAVSVGEDEQDIRAAQDIRILGSAFATYLVCEADGRLFFIDQHAARERLTYERMLEWINRGERRAQLLMIPAVRTLPAPEMNVLLEHAELLGALGLTFEQFGEMQLRFFSFPVQMDADGVDRFLSDVVSELQEHPNDPVLARDRVISSACRHSVKGGTELTEGEMRSLVREITEMDAIPFCPHGRPIAVEITRDQLEKGFRRRV